MAENEGSNLPEQLDNDNATEEEHPDNDVEDSQNHCLHYILSDMQIKWQNGISKSSVHQWMLTTGCQYNEKNAILHG
eukprot:6198584-Ditylum_brightwellii.AAC.1